MTQWKSRTSILTFLGAVLSCTTAAWAQTPITAFTAGQTGLVSFSSVTPTGPGQLLLRSALNTPATVTGTLALPANASGRVPAMVISPSCSGVAVAQTNLAQRLNQIGIATFIVDSFTGRGIVGGICTGTNTLSTAANVADAFYALKLLATHPSIDSARIGIIGQSEGGMVASATAFDGLRRGVISDTLKFAAHIGLYPAGCDLRWWSPNMTGSPMLMLLGQADDWTPAQSCMDYGLTIRSVGTPITTIVYPGAQHGWDSSSTTAVDFNAQRISAGNCRAQVLIDTQTQNRYDTGAAFANLAAYTAYVASCRTLGATLAGSVATTTAATADISIFLAKTFGLTGLALPASQPDRIFSFAESTYPTLFAPAGTASQTISSFYYRYYPQTNNYLATSGGKLYYFAPAQSPTLLEVGAEASFLSLAGQSGF
jgi:dienelactone hydrolase